MNFAANVSCLQLNQWTDRKPEGEMCDNNRFTDILSCIYDKHTPTHKEAQTSFILPALHRELILANYIQQYNVSEGRKKNAKWDNIIFHYYTHMLNSLSHT